MSLKISKYSLEIEELNKKILNKVELEVPPGQIFVLIGENGSGKSSFAMSLLGIDGYKRSGSIKVDGIETIQKETDEIARKGLFVSFQSPPEIEGVSLFNFINTSYKAIHPDSGISSFKLRKKIVESAKEVGLNESFLERSTNQGFSGGERRKSEVLQMLVLEPKAAILDEVDSGLDIKSTSNIAKVIRRIASEKQIAVIVISHSLEFIKKLEPNKVIELRDSNFEEVTFSHIEKYSEE